MRIEHARKRLTYEAVAGATGLRCTAVHVEVCVTAGSPLAEHAGRGVYDVHEMRVRRVEVSGPVVAHVKYYRRVQPGDPADLAGLDEIGREAGYVSPDAVSDQNKMRAIENHSRFPTVVRLSVTRRTLPHHVQLVRRNSAWMFGQVVGQLSDAHAAKPGRPFHLAQTRYLRQRRIVDDDDVVVASGEISCAPPSERYGNQTQKPPFEVNKRWQNVCVLYSNLPFRRSVLGDRFLPPWKPCTIIFTGCFGLKWDAYRDSGSDTFNKSGLVCVSLKPEKVIVYSVCARTPRPSPVDR